MGARGVLEPNLKVTFHHQALLFVGAHTKANGKCLAQRAGAVLFAEFSFLLFVSLSWVVMVIFAMSF